MPTFLRDTFSNFFNRILQFGHGGNLGTPTSTTNIQAGDGSATSLNLSDDVLSVQPVNDDSVGTFLCKSQGGSNILAVDTTNSRVLCGSSQIPALTSFKEFGVYDANAGTAGTHFLMTATGNTHSTGATTWDPPAFGTGASPSTSLAHTTDPRVYFPTYWYLANNITLDEVRVIATAQGDTTMNFHLMSFDVVTGSGSTAGNLSNGVYNAASGSYSNGTPSLSPITVEDDRMTITTLTINTADISSGKVVLATYENVGGTDDVSVQLIIKYHIR